MGFDPMVPENWRYQRSNIVVAGVSYLVYSYTSTDLPSQKTKGSGLFAEYGSLQAALEDTFPDLLFSGKGNNFF